MQAAILTDLPMPPRLSDCYARHRRSFKTSELKAYEKAMLEWWQQHTDLTRAARAAVDPLHGGEVFVRLDRYFIFPYAKLITKDGRAKEIDATNRIKAFDDAISNLLQIDDRYFVSGVCEKILGEGEGERAIAVLTKTQLRREHDLTEGVTPRAIRVAWESEQAWAWESIR